MKNLGYVSNFWLCVGKTTVSKVGVGNRPPRLDCALDAQAIHVADSTGRIVHGVNGGDAVVTALLDAAIAALAHLDGTVPAVLRLPVSPTGAFERAALLIARIWDPPQRLHRERRRALRGRWDALRMP